MPRKERYREDPEKHRAAEKRRRQNNPEHVRKLDRERIRSPEERASAGRTYYQKNKVKLRAYGRMYEMKRRYGLSLERYAELVAERGPNCPICLREKKPAVDHCHETGFVRGLPCRECNAALGLAHDDPSTLRRMADYIEKANVIRELLR